MISVEEARARARRLVERRQRAWAATGADEALTLGLQPPTERAALTDVGAAIAWRDAWAAVESSTVHVAWEQRAWASAGAQRVPTRLRITEADAIAAFAGTSTLAAWERLRDRASHVRTALGGGEEVAAAVQRHVQTLADLDDAACTTLLDVVAWLVAHPATGYRPRQVPIRGVDSKWLGTHRTVVTSLVGAVTGEPSLGLVEGASTVRVRVLDAALLPDGPHDFAAPTSELDALRLQPRTVLIVENLESLLVLPPMPGIVAAHGSGFAVSAIADVGWVQSAPKVYWGDLDSHGFAVLHRLRTHHAAVTTVLMDTETLLAHRDLWVQEPTPARGTYTALTPAEQATLEALHEHGDVRLEQERIPWAGYALPRLVEALA